MKPFSAALLLLALVFPLAACSPNTESPAETAAGASCPDEGAVTSPAEHNLTAEDPMEQKKELVLCINGNKMPVRWEDNDTVDALIAHIQNEDIIVDTTLYGGFEQVGSLPQSFVQNDVQMTTVPGDIVLYSGDQLVVFFGSNSWRYTKLGHIQLPVDALTPLLSSNTARMEISGI